MVGLTLGPPPGEVTHWTASAMAKAWGIPASSVQRIWRSHGLAPHRFRQFKLSKDPKFVEKLQDIVGLYMAPPAHALVLSSHRNGSFELGYTVSSQHVEHEICIKPFKCFALEA